MNIDTREYLPAILNGVAAITVLLLSFLVDFRFSMPRGDAKLFGILIVLVGILIAVWATIHIREAILGEVEPRLERLVKDGPYRFVRHPVYLGMTIALAGAALALRSWIGLAGVFIFFLPSEIYRAKLEEKALSCKFGNEWEEYASHTGFILPFIGRRTGLLSGSS